MAQSRIKQHYKGIFNLNREVHILYCYAYTPRQAWAVFCQRLAAKHEILPRDVMKYFDGSKDNYEISLETEIREDD